MEEAMFGQRIKALAGILVVTGLLAAMPAANAAQGPEAFIQSLGDEVLGVIKSGSAREQKVERFRAIFGRAFDVEQTAKFVLGRHWRTASEQQRASYVDLFRSYVPNLYGQQFANFTGVSFKVLQNRRVDDAVAVVSTRIEQPGKQPIACDFTVRNQGGGYKIVDVVVEGVSLLVTKRQEFDSVISREGMDGLLAKLRQKAA
jgi:phospholipid transport system substrate-binding protein